MPFPISYVVFDIFDFENRNPNQGSLKVIEIGTIGYGTPISILYKL